MSWLREAISDSRTNKASAKRIAMLMAALSMSAAVVILALAALMVGRDVAAALGAIAVPLAGLAGYGYVNGKAAEAKRDGGTSNAA
jgi:uncharacterized membrane protein YebE (DUF533 family)